MIPLPQHPSNHSRPTPDLAAALERPLSSTIISGELVAAIMTRQFPLAPRPARDRPRRRRRPSTCQPRHGGDDHQPHFSWIIPATAGCEEACRWPDLVGNGLLAPQRRASRPGAARQQTSIAASGRLRSGRRHWRGYVSAPMPIAAVRPTVTQVARDLERRQRARRLRRVVRRQQERDAGE
jgi:hypothetical protein